MFRWKSFTKMREINLPHDVTTMIEAFVGKLEAKYGRIYVQKCLSYLIAAKLVEYTWPDAKSSNGIILN